MGQDVMIVSKQNERIREAKRLNQKKYRDQRDMFRVEGVRLVEEALATPLVQEFFYTERLLTTGRGQELVTLAQTQGVQVFRCSESVLSELTDTVNSQGVVCTVRKPKWSVASEGLLLIADEIQDPGNMGTLLRTAVAAGVKGLIGVEGSVDIYNSKVLRASMGAVFHLPHKYMQRDQVLDFLETNNLSLVVADLEDAHNFWEVRYPQNLAVVIGNEARGVHTDFLDGANLKVKIPLVGQIESLNASVAAGVLLYEILRQHRCYNSNSVL